MNKKVQTGAVEDDKSKTEEAETSGGKLNCRKCNGTGQYKDPYTGQKKKCNCKKG